MAKECIACGNTNEDEIVYETVYVTDEVKRTKKRVWKCLDELDDECGMRIYGKND